jgi:uncharacterized damage-inducible protein DinB
MSEPLPIVTLFNYHWHTTQQLLDSTANLSVESYHEHSGYGQGSLHDIFFHLLRVDNSWRIGLESGKQQAGFQPSDFLDLAAIRAGFAAEQVAWSALLGSLSAEDLLEPLALTNWRGDPMVLIRWRVFQQVILHGMQHHAELAQLLTIKGQSPGNIDFLFYQGV